MSAKSEARLRVDRMLRILGPGRGKLLLVGEMEGMLARRGAAAGWEVTWLEPHEGEGAEAAAQLPAIDGCTRLRGDPGRLPFSDSSFDAAASQFTLDYLDYPDRALAEWARVLKQGGTLALAARNGLYRGSEQRPTPRPVTVHDPAALRRLVEGAGLAVSEVSTLIPDLKLAALYRGDLSFCLALERLPGLRDRGRIIFLQAGKGRVMT